MKTLKVLVAWCASLSASILPTRTLMAGVIAMAAVSSPTAFASTIPSVADLYDSPYLEVGESLHLRFRFDDVATADARRAADMVFISWGSSSHNVAGVSTSLYLGERLIGTHATSWPGALGFFVTPDSAFSSVGALQKTVVDSDALREILSGAEAELVVAPIFTSADGYIVFSGWGIQSAKGIGAGNFAPTFPSARLLPSASVEVDEPANAAIFLSSLLCLLFFANDAKRNGSHSTTKGPAKWKNVNLSRFTNLRMTSL